MQNVTDRRQTDGTSYHKRDRTTQYGRLKTKKRRTTKIGVNVAQGGSKQCANFQLRGSKVEVRALRGSVLVCVIAW